jgi:hypothetical protein
MLLLFVPSILALVAFGVGLAALVWVVSVFSDDTGGRMRGTWS